MASCVHARHQGLGENDCMTGHDPVLITSAAKVMINLRRFGGDRVWDAAMRKQYGL